MNSSTSGDHAQGRPVEPTGDNAVRRRTTCRLCNSPDVELVLALTPTPPVDAFVRPDRLAEAQPSYPLDLFLCHACGHAQMLDVVSPEVLFGSYFYETASSPGLVEHFRQYADDLVRRVNPSAKSLVVDVGSNDGTLLRFFKARDLRVIGVDPAAAIARKASASGVETKAAFFTLPVAQQIRQEHGPAAIVTANNVFAHSDDLGEMADAVRALLADDGVFVFEVSYVLDMINGMIFDLIYHEHLSYHSVKSLASFLRRHGLELTDVLPNVSKGGSLRCIAQITGGPRPIAPAVASMIEHEDAIGLDRPEIYREWAARIDVASAKVSALVADLRAKGKTFAGYGASATATVLIYRFGLGEAIDFIVDDIPERQGRFSPGHHIPVVPAQALYDRKPDYVLILAWRFAEMIIAKHKPYLDQGGSFIIPLPELRSVS